MPSMCGKCQGVKFWIKGGLYLLLFNLMLKIKCNSFLDACNLTMKIMSNFWHSGEHYYSIDLRLLKQTNEFCHNFLSNKNDFVLNSAQPFVLKHSDIIRPLTTTIIKLHCFDYIQRYKIVNLGMIFCLSTFCSIILSLKVYGIIGSILYSSWRTKRWSNYNIVSRSLRSIEITHLIYCSKYKNIQKILF